MALFLTLRLCDQGSDVKLAGWRQDTYLPRDVGGMAVQRRANDVPAKWMSTVVKCDRVYNGTPRGTEGPVARLLQSRSYAMGLAFGLFGEWSRKMDLYIEEAAKVGSRVPGWFGCCPAHSLASP